MGEKKRKGKLREQVLTHFPYCIYCGGMEPATSVDHVPPRALFDLRRRPRGLEFPSCDACNSGSRLDDLTAAMISRMYPDAREASANEEVRRIISAISTNRPGLLQEMALSREQQRIARVGLPPNTHALNAKGPILNKIMTSFAAKMGFALHFELYKKPVPPSGGASVFWLTNYQIMNGDIPQPLLKLLGDPKTLRQGRWSVGEQFAYASAGTGEAITSAHYAEFREAFAVCAFVSEQASRIQVPLNTPKTMTLFVPGWLRQES